jgi:hypothetical protein
VPFDPQPSLWKFRRHEGDDKAPEVKKEEQVNHPAHYTSHPSGIEAITVTSGFGFVLGNVIKYVWRAGLKSTDPLPDLKKARWYLDYHIKSLEDAKDGVDRGPGSRADH